MGGSVLVATPDSVHSTFIEVQLLIIPQRLRLTLRVRPSGLEPKTGVRLALQYERRSGRYGFQIGLGPRLKT